MRLFCVSADFYVTSRIKRDYLVPVIWRWAIYNWEVDSALAIISDPNNNSLGKSGKCIKACVHVRFCLSTRLAIDILVYAFN